MDRRSHHRSRFTDRDAIDRKYFGGGRVNISPASNVQQRVDEKPKPPVVVALTRSVELKRAYKFRIYPLKVQAAELDEWARQLKRLYNLSHDQRLLSLQRNRT